MTTLSLKTNIHKIVDKIENEQLLQTIYDFLKSKESSSSGNLWNSLTDEQKAEVLLAYDESEDDSKLTHRSKIL